MGQLLEPRFLYEMVREALWLYIDVSSHGRDTTKFSHFVDDFESTHWLLLQGGEEPASGITLTRGSDACVLNYMAHALNDFGSFRDTMVQLYTYEDFQKLQRGYVQQEAATVTLVQA
eukprot:Skav228617  [mRNA]  locus=scaffold2037:93042:98074:+ [translate_table: standard]